MELAFAITAHAAEVTPDGKIWVLGGDFEVIHAPGFPVVQPAMALVVKIRLQPMECDQEHHLRVELIDQDAHPLREAVTLPFTPRLDPNRPGRALSLSMVLNFQALRFETSGDYAFVILVDDAQIGNVPLTLQSTAQPTA
jgi:hypothetical protein